MYKSRRRPWVKLYCREWLTSTVRFGLTESDRSRFIDLLALAGDSKVPGVVCAGYEQGKPSGYPIDWLASTMRCDVSELQKSLEKFVKSDRVSITGSKEQPIIRISAWNKYQSEYLRQIEAVKARKKQQTSTQSDAQSSVTSTQSADTEGEVEVDVEGEVEEEGEKSTPLPLAKPEKRKSKTQLRREASRVRGCSPREEFERPPAYVAPIVREWQGFELFMAAYPKDTNIEHARKVWNETKPPFDEAMNGLERWKSSDRWKSQDGKFIPDAWRFLENRNWKENPKARIERDMSFGMERLDRLALD